MTPLILVFALAAPAAAGLRNEPPRCIPIERECVRVPCSMECWTVLAQYVVNLAPEDSPPDERTRTVLDGGLWGDEAGAACHARRIMREGVWVDHPLESGRRLLVLPSSASPGQVLE